MIPRILNNFFPSLTPREVSSTTSRINQCSAISSSHEIIDIGKWHRLTKSRLIVSKRWYFIKTSIGRGVLLVNASNAFSSLFCAALLWNVCVLWHHWSWFVFNTYQGWATILLRGSKEFLYSMEGVTQGDPLSLFLYAIGMLPLICHLKSFCSCTQIWYADDASVYGILHDLFHWFVISFFFHGAPILVAFQMLLSAMLSWIILFKLRWSKVLLFWPFLSCVTTIILMRFLVSQLVGMPLFRTSCTNGHGLLMFRPLLRWLLSNLR